MARVGEGSEDVFGVEKYSACRTEGVSDESAVDSVVEIEGSNFHKSREVYMMQRK